jgi:pyroglutamyl-peptidase
LKTERTILVTGFAPFGGEVINASWEAAQKLEGWRRGEYRAAARLVPCVFDDSITKFMGLFEALRPEVVIMAGQAARRALISVERFARNWDNAGMPDNSGVTRKAVEVSVGPGRLEATAPVEAIASAIRGAGVPARVSLNAGNFVCNHLYFGALHYLSTREPATRAVFVHLPATPEQSPPRASPSRLSAMDAAAALRAAAAALIDS